MAQREEGVEQLLQILGEISCFPEMIVTPPGVVLVQFGAVLVHPCQVTLR
jgi:hypothetical protein